VNFSNNTSGYYGRRRKKQICVIVSAVILILAAVGVIIYCESCRPVPADSLEMATPAPTMAADLTEPVATVVPTQMPGDVQTSAGFEGGYTAEVTPEPTPEVFEADLLKVVRNGDGVKTAYLTFDDGPTKSITPQILDVLRRYNVKATFFMLGTLIESNPDMARRVYEEGHLLANHSYAHDYSDLYATSEGFISEVQKTEQLIKNITGEEEIFRLFRYPGGSYNAGYWGENKQIYKQVLADMGYYYCDWNCLNGDAERLDVTAPELVEKVKSSSAGKEDIVILMHDAATKQNTVDSLGEIIEYLMSCGYTFARLDA